MNPNGWLFRLAEMMMKSQPTQLYCATKKKSNLKEQNSSRWFMSHLIQYCKYSWTPQDLSSFFFSSERTMFFVPFSPSLFQGIWLFQINPVKPHIQYEIIVRNNYFLMEVYWTFGQNLKGKCILLTSCQFYIWRCIKRSNSHLYCLSLCMKWSSSRSPGLESQTGSCRKGNIIWHFLRVASHEHLLKIYCHPTV